MNSLTGAFVTQVTDARMPAPALPFAFSRSYTSADTAVGPLGRGWTHSYDASLTTERDGGVTFRAADGQRARFYRRGESLEPASGVRLEMVQSPEGYEVTARDGVRHAFDSTGVLRELSDRNDNRVSLGYGPDRTLERITDPAGRVVRVSHDEQGHLSGLRLPDGRLVSFSYEGDLLTSVRDLSGNVSRYEYDDEGRLTRTVDPDGRLAVESAYDDDGRVESQTDAAGEQTEFEWDEDTQTSTMTDPRGGEWRDVYAKNRLVARVDPVGHTARFAYDAAHNLTAVTNPRGATTRMEYDDRGNLIARIAPAPFRYRETYEYNARNDVTAMTDPRGKTTSLRYDRRGNVVEIVDPRGGVTRMRPERRGLLASVVNPAGGTSRMEYDAEGNLTRVESPAGRAESFAYDGVGRLVAAGHPDRDGGRGHREQPWRMAYDAADHVVRATNPLGHTARIVYDRAGRRTEVVDAKGRHARYDHDARGLLTRSIAPGGAVTSYEYDELARPTRRVDQRGGAWSVAYDEAGRLVERTGPSGERFTYEHDATGRLTRSVDANGNATEAAGDGETRIAYDELGRAVKVDYSGATPDVSMAYDAASNPVRMTDGQGTEEYDYDAGSQLKRVTRGGRSYSYEYDRAGQLVGRSYPDGSDQRYGYDEDGLMASASGPEGTTRYRYDSEGQVAETLSPNGVRERRSFDAAQRLVGVTAKRGGRTLSSTRLALDPTGNPTRATVDGRTHHYGYDQRDQLVSACDSARCDGSEVARYGYDAAGNRTVAEEGGRRTEYAYDRSNRLSVARGPAGEQSFGHDPNGNLVRSGARSYAYDTAGRLARVSDPGAVTSYAYDGVGKRTAAVTRGRGAGEQGLSWDPNHGLPQLALERRNGPERRYSYGRSRLSQTKGGKTRFFHEDQLGSTRALTSEKGEVEQRYSYSPYGRTSGGEGKNPIRFTGQLQDPGTGLYHLRARDYDPAAGRFLQPDPVTGSIGSSARSPYAYADNRPTALTDPTGMFTHDAIGGWVGDRAEDVSNVASDSWDATTGAVSDVASDAWDFAKENPALVTGIAAVGVCALTAGVGCAVAGVVSAGVGIGESAVDNGILPGGAKPNWGEFAIDSALSYGGGKAIGYARDLSRPLRLGARSDDIARSLTGGANGRQPFGRSRDLVPPPARAGGAGGLAARGQGFQRHVSTQGQRLYRTGVGALGMKAQRRADAALP
ncbi:MAG: RHS repeat-associated core domain-containing protein [Thermoleophilaceae bacterium]